MWEKIRKVMHQVCDVIEFIVAICVVVALVISLVRILPGQAEELMHSKNTEAFLEFLEEIFNIVVGIEFIKMLCKPNPDNVIEVLVFLVARHMIIGNNTATDIFLSVLSIAILFIVRQLIHIVHERKGELVHKVAAKIYGKDAVEKKEDKQ